MRSMVEGAPRQYQRRAPPPRAPRAMGRVGSPRDPKPWSGGHGDPAHPSPFRGGFDREAPLPHRFVLGLAWRLILLVGLVFLFVAALGREDLGAARIVAGWSSSAPPSCSGIISSAPIWSGPLHRRGPLRRFQPGFSNRGQGSGLRRSVRSARRVDQEAPRRAPQADRRQPLLRGGARRRPHTLCSPSTTARSSSPTRPRAGCLVRHSGVRVEDFAEYGEAFAASLTGAAVNRPRLVPLVTDGVPQTMLISAAVVHRLGPSSASSRCSRSRGS